MTSRKVQEDIATSSQISTKNFYGQRSSRGKIGIGEYDISKDEIDTGSGGYSNLGARGKNFQKLMSSEKNKRSDLGLHIFLPRSRCSLKKKKKKVFTSISSLTLFFSQNQGVL